MSLFVSHGAPDLLREPSPAREFLRELGAGRPRPPFVAVASAHWLTRAPAVDPSARPATIHDFSGFGAELESIVYPAAGAPAVARRAAELLRAGGFAADLRERGLDHGAWVPLALMWPDAGVPAFQVAIQVERDARHHFAMGRALRPLCQEGGQLLASGGATHDLSRLGGADTKEDRAFDDWLVRAVESGDLDALLDWERAAPFARRAHPSPDHFLPLFVALGAAGDAPRGRALHRSVTYGSLHMTAFEFLGAPAAA